MAGVNKTRLAIGWVLSALPVLAMTGGGINKLRNNPELVEKLPYISSLPLLGVLAITCVLFYLIPKTSNIGFFLMCSYLGGAIVGELAMGEFPLVGLVLSVCLYVGTMLRKPELSGLGI